MVIGWEVWNFQHHRRYRIGKGTLRHKGLKKNLNWMNLVLNTEISLFQGVSQCWYFLSYHSQCSRRLHPNDFPSHHWNFPHKHSPHITFLFPQPFIFSPLWLLNYAHTIMLTYKNEQHWNITKCAWQPTGTEKCFVGELHAQKTPWKAPQ